MTIAVEVRAPGGALRAALRSPAELVDRWEYGDDLPVGLLLELAGLSVASMAAFGAVLRLGAGPGAMLWSSVALPAAVVGAFLVALPSLYVFGAALGSELRPTGAAVAALGGLVAAATAMAAALPICWFFAVAGVGTVPTLVVQLGALAAAAVCAGDAILRGLREAEPDREALFDLGWFTLVGIIAVQLIHILGVLG